jgi:hypothetical protein
MPPVCGHSFLGQPVGVTATPPSLGETRSAARCTLFYTFSDSSFHDNFDTGRSTGGYQLWYRGAIVDFASSVPTPVALSSTESEYNQCANACRADTFLRMLLWICAVCTQTLQWPSRSYWTSVPHSRWTTLSVIQNTHITRRWHYVRSQASGRFAVLLWVLTEFMLSDILIKALDGHAPIYVPFCAICENVMDP